MSVWASSSAGISQKILALFKEPKLNYYTIVLAQEIQETIRKRKTQGVSLDPYLEKFLTIDFDTKVAFDIAPQTKLHWPTMIPLLPQDHGLEIPKVYR